MWICYRVHDGSRAGFCSDEWCGQSGLHSQFPFLYYLDLRQHALVADYFCSMEKGVVWDFSFRRNLTDIEIADFVRLLGFLDKYYFSSGKSDVRLWKPDVRGLFSVKSFYKVFVCIGCRNGRLVQLLGLLCPT